MNTYKLNNIGEIAPIYTDILNSVNLSLMWSKDDDLDLMVFYKTKDGITGSVYSENIPGGFYGDLDKFPFISCGESGLDDSSDDIISYEKISISDFSQLGKLFFVVTNYAEIVLKKNIKFSDYQAVLKISPSYSSDKKNVYLIKANSEEKGDFLVVCEIEVSESTLMLKNTNQVMTFEELVKTIPGTNKLKI
jgi:hypothetical protein